MNLIIDIGNTKTKIFIYGSELIYQDVQDQIDISYLSGLVIKHSEIRNGILSATGAIPEGIDSFLKDSLENYLLFNNSTPLPFNTEYETPDSIGLDRLAGVAGALSMNPDLNSLIIDAGTAITYDMVNSSNIHSGGNISPGLSVRFKALHDYTDKLPLVKASDTKNYIGKTTQEAILNGVVNGIIFEMEGTISEMEKIYGKLTVLLTGGDSSFFDNKLKKTIFVAPNLVSLGLNSILNYNVEKI